MAQETFHIVRDEVRDMCAHTVEMLALAWKGFKTHDLSPLDAAEKLGREIHNREKRLTDLIGRQDTAVTADKDSELLFIPMHLERIGDNVELLIRAARTTVREGIPFTERAMREINTLFEKALEFLECIRDAIPTRNRVLLRHVQAEGERHQRMANEFALHHQERLIEGLCMPKASPVYLAILDYLKGIISHTRQVAQRLSSGAAAPAP